MTREEMQAIIAQAVENEVESYEFYRDAAEKAQNDAVRDIFKDLAKEELEHKKFLEDFLDSGAKTITLSEVEGDYKLAEEMEMPRLSTDMPFTDAIALAIKKEEGAMIMYQGLADACKDPQEADLFLGLRNMEQLHKTRLEEIFVSVAYSEAW